jgi:hypothetical protein
MVLVQWSDISRLECPMGWSSLMFREFSQDEEADGYRNKSGGNPTRKSPHARRHVGARKDIRSRRPSIGHRVA